MRLISPFLLILFLSVIVTGCADIETPSPAEILKNPIGSGSVKIGMTKSQVVSLYGEPDLKNIVTSKEWGGAREEWLYRGRYTAIPISAGYLSKDVYLYFDGNSLTKISKDPLGTRETAPEKDSDNFIK